MGPQTSIGELEQEWIVVFAVAGTLAFILLVLLIIGCVYFSGKEDKN